MTVTNISEYRIPNDVDCDECGGREDECGCFDLPTTDSHAIQRSLIAVLVILQFLDIATTNVVLSLGGGEANPVMAPIIHNPILPIALKLTVCGVLGALAYRSTPRFGTTILSIASIGYLSVVAWNLHNLQGAL